MVLFPASSHDIHPNLFLRFLFNLGRNIKATGLWFLAGVLLSALFQRYVPADMKRLYGKGLDMDIRALSFLPFFRNLIKDENTLSYF